MATVDDKKNPDNQKPNDPEHIDTVEIPVVEVSDARDDSVAADEKVIKDDEIDVAAEDLQPEEPTDPADPLPDTRSVERADYRAGERSRTEQVTTTMVGNGHEPPRRSLAGWVAILLALLALGLSAFTLWNQRQIKQASPVAVEFPDWNPAIAEVRDDLSGDFRQELAASQSAVDERISAQSRQTQQVSQQMAQLEQQITASTETAARVEAQLNQAVAGIQERIAGTERGLGRLAQADQDAIKTMQIAEAEFLLSLANERLQLFGDPKAAARTLQLADQMLAGLDDPMFSPVRQSIAREAQALAAVDAVDIQSVSGRLSQLISESRHWPLDDQRTISSSSNMIEAEQSEEADWWARFRNTLSEHVVVHRDPGQETVLLTLEEERLLRENASIQLSVAQLAAARSDQETFESALTRVRGWLAEYYRQGDPAVRQAMESLRELSTVELNPELPAIGSSLRLLRQVRAADDLGQEARPDQGSRQ